MSEMFHRFAEHAADAAGSPWAFVISIIVLLIWALVGPFFHFSDTWQLTINTVASIIPTIMVFLIQNTQNRDARALHLKLDELLRDHEGPQSPFINLQELSEKDIDRLARQFTRLAERPKNGPRTSQASQIKGASHGTIGKRRNS